MTPVTEEKIIEEKLKEISRLVEEREQIQSRISKLETAVRAFIELLEDDVDQQIYTAKLTAVSKPLGITNAVKRALASAKSWLTPADVREILQEDGFPLSGYSNALAVLYTTLNRLTEQGVAEKNAAGQFRADPLAGLATPSFQQLAGVPPLPRKPKK